MFFITLSATSTVDFVHMFVLLKSNTKGNLLERKFQEGGFLLLYSLHE